MKNFFDNYNKIMMFPDELDLYLNNGNPYPIVTEIDISQRCNSNCPGCQYGILCQDGSFKRKLGALMTFNQLKNIIDQLRGKIKGLVFSGASGDPLVNPDVVSIINYSAKYFPIIFITNGIAINKQIAETLMKNCVGLRISLDAGTADLYKITHGMPEIIFNQVLNNIRLLVRARKECDSTCSLGIGFLTGKWGKTSSVPEMLIATKLAKDLSVDYIQFRTKHFDKENINDKLSLCKGFETKNFKVFASTPKYDLMGKKRIYSHCHMLHFFCVIDADLSVWPCCHLVGVKRFCLGNLKKQSFEIIWNSEKRQKIINSINPHSCLPLCRGNSTNIAIEKIKNGEIDPKSLDLSSVDKKHAVFL